MGSHVLFLDIEAIIRTVSREIQVGGGIRSIQTVRLYSRHRCKEKPYRALWH